MIHKAISMNLRNLAKSLCMALPILLGSGCVTGKVWESEKLTVFREAAKPSRLEVRLDERKKDYLVSYDETADNADSIMRRSYYLHANLERTSDVKKPFFADRLVVEELLATSPLASSPGEGGARYISISANDTFTIHDGARADGPHSLPVYKSRNGTITKIALTPLAVVADVTVVGAVAGVWLAPALAGVPISGPNPPPK
jgi:hypothetical protein